MGVASTRPRADGALVVRSSGSAEDSARYSFAGQFDSFLNVRGDKGLVSAVNACWASAYGERALAYRKQHRLSSGPIWVEVILQAMVPAGKAGGFFTAQPFARAPHL